MNSLAPNNLLRFMTGLMSAEDYYAERKPNPPNVVRNRRADGRKATKKDRKPIARAELKRRQAQSRKDRKKGGRR